MAYDRNPQYGKDQAFAEGARRVTDFLWETTGGDLTAFPQSYLETLRHDYADGKVSMLEFIDKVDLGPEATYDDYCEVVESLLKADPGQFNSLNGIVELQPSHLQYELENDFDFSEFDFAEEVAEQVSVEEGPQGTAVEESMVDAQPADPLSDKMELFLKKVISSVYRDGVTAVTDSQGNPPNAANNYLLSADGSKFEGIFYDAPPNETAKQYPFVITEKGPEQWAIQY
jgi:hypothetical protein